MKSPLFDREWIFSQAGEKFFQRGVELHKNNSILSFDINDSVITAIVRGTEDYTIQFSFENDSISHSCTCPIGRRDKFCKHQVAVALAVLAQTENPQESDTKENPETPKKIISEPICEPIGKQKNEEFVENVVENVREKTTEKVGAKIEEEIENKIALSPKNVAEENLPLPAKLQNSTQSSPNKPPSSIDSLLAFSTGNLATENEVIPARMLNEFVYCPRLFYYEHVEGLFLHNADTIEGKNLHSKLDASPEGLPTAKKKTNNAAAQADDKDASSDEPETIHARSVQLASDKLGVTAKLDLVEGSQDENGDYVFMPVEYKRGAPREGENANLLWDSDKMQLGLQILLLRENGYPCNHGVIFYRATRQRVTYEITENDIVWIKEKIRAARAIINAPIPPPLDNSPKCPRCSLAPICLPDESSLLARISREETPPAEQQLELSFDCETFDFQRFKAILAEESFPLPKGNVRRLIAPNDETRALYLNTPGSYVAQKGETLVVKNEGEIVNTFRLLDLHHLSLFGAVQISTGAVQSCCEHDIPISFFSSGGFFYGITRGNSLPNVFTRIAQFKSAAMPELALPFAQRFVHGKILNQRLLLKRNHVELEDTVLENMKILSGIALKTNDTASLLGIEGTAARIYFENFQGMIRPERAASDTTQTEFQFFFKERNRRPPRDPVNAVLSLCYSLLVKDCTFACFACGLDPYVGFLHQPRHGKPALALDLMEEFRPLIAESVTLRLLNNKMLKPSDFIYAGSAVNLTPKARKEVFLAYEKRLNETITHPLFNYKVCYRRAIQLQARLLGKVLTEEIDGYIPFMTR